MKVYILVNNRKNLPEFDELVAAMWERGISFSRLGDSASFKKCTVAELSWDKWISDSRWSGKGKPHEFIEFRLPKKINNYANSISIEVADDALPVDKRAFHKAALYIAERADGKISTDKNVWMTPEEYLEEVKRYMQYTFQEAAEESLRSISS